MPEEIIYATRIYNFTHVLDENSKLREVSAPKLALHNAASCGNLEAVEHLIEAGHLVSKIDKAGLTPLYYASEGGYIDISYLLINKEADVNTQGGRFGNTLQEASCGGHQAVVELLLKRSASVNAQGGYYSNALWVASFGGYQAVVELLLKKGADVDAQGGPFDNAL